MPRMTQIKVARAGALALFALVALASRTPFAAETSPRELIGKSISAHVVALDGDTLLILDMAQPHPAITLGKTRIRLWGIAAPEMKILPGWYSRAVLDELLERTGHLVACEIVDTHKERLVGRCKSNRDGDLGHALQSAGASTSYRIFTWHAAMTDAKAAAAAAAYDAAEFQAILRRRGIWADLPAVDLGFLDEAPAAN